MEPIPLGGEVCWAPQQPPSSLSYSFLQAPGLPTLMQSIPAESLWVLEGNSKPQSEIKRLIGPWEMRQKLARGEPLGWNCFPRWVTVLSTRRNVPSHPPIGLSWSGRLAWLQSQRNRKKKSKRLRWSLTKETATTFRRSGWGLPFFF